MESNGTEEVYETLKQILRSVRTPELLDEHPWTRSLIAQEARAASPELSQASPGQQLVGAIASLFPELKPAGPPRRGKRLDPRWGEFGLLAALYFTPFNHGRPFPTSLPEAWARIDEAILHFVFGKPAESLQEDNVRKYELVGSDVEYAAASTLSDWHKKGIQRFADVLLDRERFLARSASEPSIILDPEGAAMSQAERRAAAAEAERVRSVRLRRFVLGIGLLVLALASLGAFKAWRIYKDARVVYDDLTRLQVLIGAPAGFETLEVIVPELHSLRADLSALEEEAGPALRIAPRLGWIPGLGPDLASAPELLETAGHLLDAAILAEEAVQPILKEFSSGSSTLDPAGLTALLAEAQPRLGEARRELDLAIAARDRVEAGTLSPRLQNLVQENLDAAIDVADEGLSLALALPGLLGAGEAGPKTYMLLPQNEDELRPTGGFITSVGNLVIHNGEVIRLDFESIDNDQVDWSLPYPLAPWQLRQYMNSNVLLLRDSNWFTDFPTTVLWAEYLYAYSHAHSVDGVIAFDQQFLVMLLGVIGPLEIAGEAEPITTDNVLQYMREAKIPPPGLEQSPNWYRKEFIGKLGTAVLATLTQDEEHDWPALAAVITRALDERHLLLQFDDPEFADLIAARGWDNAVRPPAGDFLLVTDTNIGFNKTNAVVKVDMTYDADLTDVLVPRGTLFVSHKNNASPDVPCLHWAPGELPSEDSYPINRCYWNYLRVYKQADTRLLDASPHSVPSNWLVSRQGIPARVDNIDEELPGVSTFGTLMVVPGGESLSTGFEFSLPGAIVESIDGSGTHVYRLKVQKQPGTLAIPLTLRVHLPGQASLISTSYEAVVQGNSLLFKLNLRTDVELEVRFELP